MTREVILVEVVTQSDMSTDKSKTFTNTEKAESYFTDIMKTDFDITDEEMIGIALDCGFFDDDINGKSIIIKEISFEED